MSLLKNEYFHRYLFGGHASFEITNTKTGNNIEYCFLSRDVYRTEFILYCEKVNNKDTPGIGTIGDFSFEERHSVKEIPKYRYELRKDVKDTTMEFKTFIYLLHHRDIPEFIHIRVRCCAECARQLRSADNDGFCYEHKGVKESLFDPDARFWG